MAKYSIEPYAHLHKELKGPGDARPTALKIIEDQDLLGKLNGKTILITGCTSGLGMASAKALHATGAKIFITARNQAKGDAAAAEIASDGSVEAIEMDLDSFESIKKAVHAFLAKSSRLNILINNAGIMGVPEGQTKEGFELHFGTNHIGHFFLFQLLKDTMISSATPDFASRVVALSSAAHKMSTVDFENLKMEKGYDILKAYGQSKTANIWFANEIERRYSSQNLHAFSVHPGSIVTKLDRHLADYKYIWEVRATPEWQGQSKNAEQGAATQVWAAVAKELEGKGGVYLENVQVSGPLKPGSSVLVPGYAPYAYDEPSEKRLWLESLRMTGLSEN